MDSLLTRTIALHLVLNSICTVLGTTSASANSESLELIRDCSSALQESLGIYKDPFRGQVTLDQQISVWNQLIRAFPLLPEVRGAVYQALKEQSDLDLQLELKVIRESQRILAKQNASSFEQAGALISLQKLQQVYDFRIPPTLPKADPEKSKGPDQKKTENHEKEKTEKKEKQPPNPEWPDLSDHYKAHNKDSDKSDGQPQERVTLAWVDQPRVAYFRGAVYQGVNARTGAWNMTEITAPDSSSSGPATNTLTVKPFQKKGAPLKLLVPQGFIPQTFNKSDSSVWRDSRQNYYFKTTLDELKVQLVPLGRGTRPLSPSERDVYTSPTGVSISEWPEHLREQIENLQTARTTDQEQGTGRYSGPRGDIQLAKDLGAYIARHFKYKVDRDDAQGPLDATHRGAFQCDIAATVLTSILRDGFAIPARPVGGFMGMSHKEKPSSSHVTSPADGHAWVEVADLGGNWWSIDPTPRQKDRKLKEESSDDPYQNILTEEDKDDSEDANLDSERGQGNSGIDSEKTLKELTDEWKKLQAKRGKAKEEAKAETQAQAQAQAQGIAGTKGKDQAQKNPPDSFDPSGESENIPQLAESHLDKVLGKTHPALAHLLKRYFLWVLHPSLSSSAKLERLSQAKSALSPLAQFQKVVTPTLTEAFLVFSNKNPPMIEWLSSILSQVSKRPLHKTVDDLIQLQSQVQFLVKFMEPEESEPWKQLLNSVQLLRKNLNSIRHPDSKALRIAEDLMSSLPGKISRQALISKYGLNETIGDDVGTFNLAKDIGQGKLNEFRLESLLGPHTDFVVDPIQHPSWSTLKTWNRAIKKQKGRFDLLSTSDPRDRRKFVRLNPTLSDEEALKRREMYVLTQRRQTQIPAGYHDTDPEKATVLLYDTSGSMRGDPAYFQSMYIAALVDRALSDTGAQGRARHQVYIMGFDSQVHSPIEVTTPKQALDLVMNAKSRTRNTAGSTDIQKALIGAADLLTEANNRGDRALARATVVLMSDGESPVDCNAVKAAFAKTDMGKRTKMDLLLAFVAINGSNPELEKLARKKDLGANKSMYVEWSSEDISKTLSESRAVPSPLNDFWTNTTFDQLPQSIRSNWDLLQKSLGVLQSQKAKWNLSQDLLKDLAQSLSQNHNLENQRSGTQVAALRQIRRALAVMSPHMAQADRRALVGNLVRHWSEFFHDEVQKYDTQEVANLKFILEWVDQDKDEAPSQTQL